MKRFVPAIILFCLFSSFAKAQYMPLTEQFMKRMYYGHENWAVSEVQGSPYLDKEYKMGTILTDGDVLYKDIPLRYNCYDDLIEFKKDNLSYNLEPKTIVKRAEFGGQVFVCKDFESNGETGKSYFELLVEGKASLCVRYTIKFFEGEPTKGYADAKPPRFDDFEKFFYISLNNSPAKKILNNKKLVEILDDKKAEIESYISKQKFSTKKVEDLKKIVAYYNSL